MRHHHHHGILRTIGWTIGGAMIASAIDGVIRQQVSTEIMQYNNRQGYDNHNSQYQNITYQLPLPLIRPARREQALASLGGQIEILKQRFEEEMLGWEGSRLWDAEFSD